MQFHIGCSGWMYKDWRGRFYPKEIPVTRWLEYYATIFDTVELNMTFYRLPTEATVTGWLKRAPKEFTFAAKASRLITHYRRLKDTEEALHVYFDRIKKMRKKLGPILYQLPERFTCDYDLLESFLRTLPKGYTHVFELRHPSWWISEVFELLNTYKAGFCVYLMEETSTPFVATGNVFYMRFHGPVKRYRGSYSSRQLVSYAKKIAATGARSAWIYFNNTDSGSAFKDAIKLQTIVKKL